MFPKFSSSIHCKEEIRGIWLITTIFLCHLIWSSLLYSALWFINALFVFFFHILIVGCWSLAEFKAEKDTYGPVIQHQVLMIMHQGPREATGLIRVKLRLSSCISYFQCFHVAITPVEYKSVFTSTVFLLFFFLNRLLFCSGKDSLTIWSQYGSHAPAKWQSVNSGYLSQATALKSTSSSIAIACCSLTAGWFSQMWAGPLQATDNWILLLSMSQ